MKKTMKKLFAFGMAGMMAAGLAGCSGSTQETTVAASVTEAQADTQARGKRGQPRQTAPMR